MYEARCRLTERFDRALLYATQVHGGQVRKGTTVPYLAHLLAVAATVMEYGGDEDMAIAALLHDAAEDQGGARRLDDIRNRFGDRVASFVADLSDSLVQAGEAKAEWRTRKEAYLAHLATRDADVLLVAVDAGRVEVSGPARASGDFRWRRSTARSCSRATTSCA